MKVKCKDKASCFKIIFNGVLSDYKREIVAKFFSYLHSFVVSYDSFTKEWKSFAMPYPSNCDLKEVYQHMSDSFELCVQDERCERWVNIEDRRNSAVSIMMNFALKALDKGQGVFRELEEPTCKEMSEYIRQQFDMQIPLNNWMFSFQINSTDDEDLTLDRTKMFYPNDGYWGLSKRIKDFVDTYYVLYAEGYEPYSRVKQCALYSSVLFHNMMVSFGMLCALFIDASCSSLVHMDSFIHMWCYIQYRYHNSFLYRVEMPCTPLNTTKRTDQRGVKDHTTQMKIYLFDRSMKPVLIRLDLPHSGFNYLHANISTVRGKKVEGDDHLKFNANCTADDLNVLFDSINESIKEQTPNLFKIVDSTNKDENIIFTKMLKFLDYDALCMNVLSNEPYDAKQRKIAGFLKMDKTESIESVLLNAYSVFKQ